MLARTDPAHRLGARTALAARNQAHDNKSLAKRNNAAAVLEAARDPVAAAKLAKLRHVCDDVPGISRHKARNGFDYRLPDRALVRDLDTLKRVRWLAIPAAWTTVWICPHPNGHIQATGRDSRGRKQYRYHPRWRKVRDESKCGKMLFFGRVLPAIRERVGAHLRRRGLPRERVLAAVVRLMETNPVSHRQYRIREGEQELWPDDPARSARRDRRQSHPSELPRQTRHPARERHQ